QNHRVQQVLEMVGLTGSEKLMPAELSGGMKKRVGLARALVLEPKVMLYDEPTTGLDPVTTYTIDKLITDVRSRLGLTSLIVSHDV
ncbi:ATP-binding cassette domain-containing protein, partial [Pseudomonas aeruginosa]|uniref:ATP-binding cassette domain-containing protein n=1 Tax=Pseudomonas aeruginosa TaxID=287 RepID=UPI002B40F6B4